MSLDFMGCESKYITRQIVPKQTKLTYSSHHELHAIEVLYFATGTRWFASFVDGYVYVASKGTLNKHHSANVEDLILQIFTCSMFPSLEPIARTTAWRARTYIPASSGDLGSAMGKVY